MAEHAQTMTIQLAKDQLPQWRELMKRRPENADVIQNVGSCLFTLGETDEALKCLRVASEIDHRSAAIPMNLGMVLKDLGLFSESACHCFTAYTQDPDQANGGALYTTLGWAESLLRNGNWRDAWPIYNDAMFGTKEGARHLFQIADDTPYWRGEPIEHEEHTLLVVGEGGTGDRLNYCRWLPELTKRGINWMHFPDNAPPIPGLLSLFQRVPWLAGKFPEPGFKYSHWTTTFALPAAFDATPTKIPRYPGWFLPDAELKKRYAIAKPAGDKAPIYGLIWGANELFEGGMKFRSLIESQAMRLVMGTCDIVHWVNCWRGDAHGTNSKLGQPVLNPKFENWEETAALLSNMDGIVTTDNGAGWLAQALGLPCTVLLSGNSDWKFLRGTEKSYWSDNARLIRNVGQGFEDAVTKCIMAIRNGEGVGRVQQARLDVPTKTKA